MARCDCQPTVPNVGFFAVREGPVTDASFTVPPPVGTVYLDTTPGILYIRVAPGSWKTVTLV